MKERLARRGIISESRCPFGCQVEEELTHMFFLCPHTSFGGISISKICRG
jgi:hypothetical protein